MGNYMVLIDKNGINNNHNIFLSGVTSTKITITKNIEYGYLYNKIAILDERNITPDGWHIPTYDDFVVFKTFLNNNNKDLRDISGNYWNTDSNMWGSTTGWIPWNMSNDLGFNLKGAGFRQGDSFYDLKYTTHIWLSTENQYGHNDFEIYYLYTDFYTNQQNNYYGISARPIKDTTTLTHGQSGIYTGNDGQVYDTICIGTQEWLADNLIETKYRNGDLIPVFTGTGWTALTTPGLCYYNNDIDKAHISITGSTYGNMILMKYDDEFIFNISLTSTGGTPITLPLLNGYSYDALVDWGDGSPMTTVTSYNSAGASHTYSGSGNYDIRIRGICQSFSINNTNSLKNYITKVKFWGNCDFKALDFYGCSSLGSIPTGELTGMSGMTSMANFLRECTSYKTPLISNFFMNTPNITNFDYTFANTSITGTIPSTIFSYTTGVTTFDYTFSTTNISGNIPSTLFSYHPRVNSFAGTFSSTRVSGNIPSTLFSYTTGCTDFSYTFYNTHYITGGTIPYDLFYTNSGVTTFSNTFNNCYVAGSIPYNLFYAGTGVTDFSYTFANNPYLTGDIPVQLFANHPNVTTFNSTFSNCIAIGTGVGGTGYYTEDLFKYNPKVTDFGGTFQSTWGLTTGLTENLFKYNPNVTSFASTFGFCATLRSPLPEDLFRYNTGVTSFFNTFNKLYECPGPIPAGLFKYNTKVTTFGYCFSYGGNGYDYPHGGVGGISGDIPVDLFANCPDVVDFNWTFRWNTGAQKVPNGLFRNNLKATSFVNCFLGAQYARPEQYIFSSGSTISGITEDQAAYIRFSGKTMNFSGMFNGNSGSANSRFAPELWDSTKYNMVANTHTDCYTGTLAAYINGANIPYDWRGYYAPTITTTSISNITTNSMDSGGNITSAGGLTVTSRGVCYNTTGTPTTGDTKTVDGTGPGIFNSNLTGLSPTTTYYLRAYAINAAGVSYGSQVSASTS